MNLKAQDEDNCATSTQQAELLDATLHTGACQAPDMLSTHVQTELANHRTDADRSSTQDTAANDDTGQRQWSTARATG